MSALVKKSLPYRLGVGMMIINQENKVFVAKRIESRNNTWQMPQGGINIGETPSKAALREMKEEIGSDNGCIISESKYWYSYEVPNAMIPRLWDGKFCGQKQKWFLIKFTGQDQDINIHTANPEFVDWRWVSISEMQKIVIHFKKKLYEAIIKEFNPLLNNNLNFQKAN